VAADEEDTSEDDAEELAADPDADEEDSSDDDAEELAADGDADEEDSSDDDAEELAADADADEEDTSDDDAEELAADGDADEQGSLVDNLLLNRALRGGNPRMVLVDDLDEATIGAAKKKKAAKKKPAAKKKAKKAKKAPAKKKKKAKKVSKIGKGKMAKYLVFKGKKEKTVGGLKKSDIIKTKYGGYVSKKASASAKKKLGGWLAAVAKARKALGTKGFVAIKKGSPLYAKAKSFYKR
jgi:hypothetical protein